MKYLLDTHVLDWAQTDTDRLSQKVRRVLSEVTPDDLAISDVSLTELARLLHSGTINHNHKPEIWLRAATQGVHVLPVTIEIALRAAGFDWPHRDPCDRHIVATAIEHKLPLITIDEKIHAISKMRGLQVIW